MLTESFNDEKYLQIAQTLRDKEVDAYVMLLYSDPISFASDFEIPKIAAKKIFQTLKQKISEAAGSLSGQSCAGQDTKSSHPEGNTTPAWSLDPNKSCSGAGEDTVLSGDADGRKESKGEESSCQAQEVKESVTSVHGGLSTDEGFLRHELGFERIEFKDQSHCQVCDLVAIHCAWNQDNPNILAKSFLFWILFEEKAGVKDKQRCKEFWEAICINTQLWIDTLKAEDRKHFKPIKSAGTFQYKCSKTVKLGRGAGMKLFSEVGPELRKKFTSHILIIHDSVDTKTSPYVNVRFKKLCFRFNMAKKRHWILSPNGEIVTGGEKHEMDEEVNQAVSASGDGRNIKISDNYSQAEMEIKNNPCDGSVKDAGVKVDDVPVQATGQDEDNPNDGRDADVKVDDVLATGQGKNYCGDGRDASVKMDDMPVQATGQDKNYPGDGRDTSVKVDDASVPAKVNNKDNPLTSKGSDNLGPQMPREFKHDGSNIVYRKRSVLSRPESGSDMIIPSLEFKFFQNAVDQGSHVSKFLAETLRFACGCLNRRRNGTIFFGVADHYEREGKQYRHGEVAGFPIDDLGSESLKSLYTDKLDHAKRTYFKTSKPCKVEECMSSPRFVLVIPSLRELPWYVMEVDVEPLVAFCEGVTFKVDMSKFKGKKLELFVRDGASTKGITDKFEEENFNLYMNRYDEKRKQDEDENKNNTVLRPLRKKYLADELCNRLCRGTHPFDTSLWPILVIGKPTFERSETLYESLSFVSNINWTAVFDLDDESFVSGICKKYFTGQSTNVVTSSTFRYIPNPDQLRSELDIPGKTVYIFCNGRSDLNKPHLTGGDWENEYLASVTKSVSFLQEESIIPVGRALVIFLLLSSDTEGYLDLFKALKTFFSVENFVLLCEDETVFDSFKTVAAHSTVLKDLERCSVVGMKWDQTNDVFNKLLGVEKKYVSKIPSSLGPEHDIEVDPQFEEHLDCLHLLSSNECETKKFDLYEEKQFAYAKDLKFYKGNQVEWWNFHFPGQVVERTCFEKLKAKVGEALNEVSSGNTVVKTISLIHEPGAGGTTLARNILWHFRRVHRCAVITKLTDETASDIIDLWKYKERREDAKTVLLLIDSSTKKMDFYELHRQITSRVIKTSGQFVGRTVSPVCVILVCIRDEHMQKTRSNVHMVLYEADFTEYLYQICDEKEQKQFAKKIKELEGTSGELGLQFHREHFISFMVLHSNFNPEYIKNTTHTLLQHIDVDGNEFKLLMCVALLSAFVMSSKIGSALAIPHECCTELMGHSDNTPKNLRSYRWEDMLERALKILLIIETKENGTGKEIRMAHPSLAMAVISYVQEKCPSKSRPNEKMSLADITMAVLESGLFGSHSYAIRYVHDLIIEMFTRRKKEEYGDNEISRFSPLIEKICREAGSSYNDAVSVMEKAFEILRTSVAQGTSYHACIAQQIARLYLDNNEFVKAQKWAETAVNLNSNKSPFIHTLGHVYRKWFKSSTKKKVYYTPDDNKFKESMDRIFKALSYFERACRIEEELNLFACLDTLATVNLIVISVANTVMKTKLQKKQLLRFLTDETYVFEYISTPLSQHISNFQKLFEIGVNAIHDLDKHIYFQTKVYASQFNDNFNKEHRTSRAIRDQLPQQVKIFCDFFGESTDINSPPSYIKSKEMKDEWHRRCVVCLGANRLIGACNLVSMKNIRGKLLKTRLAILETAFEHLQLINDKMPQDLLNLVTVNFATHHLKSVKICTPIKEMLHYCDFIIRKGNETQRIDAYMYTVMLLWPRQGMNESNYDKAVMEKAINVLQAVFKESKQLRSVKERDCFIGKRENNRVRSVPLFYEGKGKGLSCLWYRDDIFDRASFQEPHGDFWQNQVNLRILKGFTKIGSNGAVSILVDSTEFGIDHQIELKFFRCKRPQLCEQPVTFYLGFSISGPAVCYILPEKTHLVRSVSWTEQTDHDNKTEDELRRLLHHIKELKNKNELTSREESLIQEESHVEDALMKFEDACDFVD